MKNKFLKPFQTLIMVFMISSSALYAETIGIFYNSGVPQHVFVAGDIQRELESKGFTVEVLELSLLTGNYANKKVLTQIYH